MNRFESSLVECGLQLTRAKPEILQLNVGKLCNLTCTHCHVNAGPNRKEIITRATLDRILDWFSQTNLGTLDLTGGAPEMIPDFRHVITTVRRMTLRRRIIDRCNLTILLEPANDGLADFLADNEVEIVASMPCYSPENVNAQRGEGVFDASIAALKMLNGIGYGSRPELPLHLVYNPNGGTLPGPQAELESDYKRELSAHFGIVFNHLYTITNLPVSRFASWLRREGKYDDYLNLLIESFNPSTVEGLMCRNTINVSWQGETHDCDFNQMLKLGMPGGNGNYVWDLDPHSLAGNTIATGNHCFGCTAGAGSSCGGSLT